MLPDTLHIFADPLLRTNNFQRYVKYNNFFYMWDWEGLTQSSLYYMFLQTFLTTEFNYNFTGNLIYTIGTISMILPAPNMQ